MPEGILSNPNMMSPGMDDNPRAAEIARIANENGFWTPLDPRFAEAFPDLSQEWYGIMQGQVSGLGEVGMAALPGILGLIGVRGAAGAAAPAPRTSIRPGVVTGEVVPPGGAPSSPSSPMTGGPRALPSGAVTGEVIPPPTPNSPPGVPPRGPIIDGTARPVPPGPQPPAPGSPPAAIGPAAPPVSVPPGAAPTPPRGGGGGILGTIINTIKGHPVAAAAATGIGIAAGAAAGIRAFSPSRPGDPNYQPAGEMDMRPGADIVAEMEKERKAKQDADEARARRIRAGDAETSLTEAQAAYYQAQREKALQELANSDLTDSEKLEVAHQYALEAAREKAKLEMDQEMVRQGGENERTGIREAGQDRRTAFQGGVEMRGQDQRAREAQDRFVVDWMQNQIARGQLSLDRATRLYEAYQKQQKLPAEILKSVSDSVAPFLPYMTNRSEGDAAPGFGAGGTMEKLAKAAGAKFNPKDFKATSNFNLFDVAAQYGGGPGQAQPMPTVDQVFQGAGQAPDINEENAARVRGMSQSSAPLSRPTFGDPSSFSDPIPDDAMERVMGGIR